jgi:hypothetical protein
MEHMAIRTILITLLITVNFAATGAAQVTSISRASLVRAVAATAPAVGAQASIAQPRRDSRLNGFLIGLVAGAVPGIWLGLGISTYCDNESTSCPAAIPLFGAIGGLAGGGIGYAIDGAIGESVTGAMPKPNPMSSPGVRFKVRF